MNKSVFFLDCSDNLLAEPEPLALFNLQLGVLGAFKDKHNSGAHFEPADGIALGHRDPVVLAHRQGSAHLFFFKFVRYLSAMVFFEGTSSWAG